jgi:hypothetical protein
VFLDSGGNELWDAMEETMNFLSSTKTGAGSGKGKGNGDIGRTIERH